MAVLNGTTIRICANVDADPTYQNIRWMESESKWLEYVASKTIKVYSNCSYQRINSSVAAPRVPLTLRVPCIVDEIANANYIAFNNGRQPDASISKWYFGFVRKLNYISPECTEVVYELDYIQSYRDGFNLGPSYVEREHVSAAEDKPFSNQVAEPITGWENYMESRLPSTGITFSPKIVVAVVPNNLVTSVIAPPHGQIISGVFNGATYSAFNADSSGAAQAQDYINKFAALSDPNAPAAIVDVFMTVTGLVTNPVDLRIVFDLEKETPVMNGYTVRNKKLMNFQFVQILIESTSGDAQKYDPQYFITSNIQGNVKYTQNRSFEAQFFPAVNEGTPYAEYVGCSFECHCVWSGSAYGSDVGATIMGAKMLAAGAGPLILGSLSGGTETGLIAGANQSINNLANVANSGTTGSYSRFTTDTLFYALRNTGYKCTKIMPNRTAAERIDSFMDEFGYAVQKIKIPNMKTREFFNYLKLKNPNIYGSMPVQAMELYKSVFSTGVKLWHTDFNLFTGQNPAV